MRISIINFYFKFLKKFNNKKLCFFIKYKIYFIIINFIILIKVNNNNIRKYNFKLI